MSKTIRRVSTAWLLTAILSAGLAGGASSRAAEGTPTGRLEPTRATEYSSVGPTTRSNSRAVVLAGSARSSVIQSAYSTILDWAHGALTRIHGGFRWVRSLLWTLTDRSLP